MFKNTFDVHIESKSNLDWWNNTQSSYSEHDGALLGPLLINT